MAIRAQQRLQGALILTFVITVGVTLAPGDRVIFGASDDLVSKAGAGEDLSFGSVLVGGTGDGKVTCQVVCDFHAIVPMKVGTGGATRGKKAKIVVDGVTDIAGPGSANVVSYVGLFVQSGVAADMVGMGVMNGRTTTA